MLYKMKRYWGLYALMLPILCYFSVVVFWPLVKAVIVSFQNFGIFGFESWAGLENYRALINDTEFWQAALNTIIIALGVTIFGFSLPVLVAIALADLSNFYAKRFFQTVIYLPNLFSWVIIIGIWIKLLAPLGLVNSILMELSLIDAPITFFSSSFWARPVLIAQTVWKDIGYHSIIYLAAIMTINPELYDAADLEGASMWKKARYITLPALIPTMKIVFLLTLLGSLRTFDVALLMENGIIKPKIETLALYTYNQAFNQFNISLANASGVILISMAIFLSIITRPLTKAAKED